MHEPQTGSEREREREAERQSGSVSESERVDKENGLWNKHNRTEQKHIEETEEMR